MHILTACKSMGHRKCAKPVSKVADQHDGPFSALHTHTLRSTPRMPHPVSPFLSLSRSAAFFCLSSGGIRILGRNGSVLHSNKQVAMLQNTSKATLELRACIFYM